MKSFTRIAFALASVALLASCSSMKQVTKEEAVETAKKYDAQDVKHTSGKYTWVTVEVTSGGDSLGNTAKEALEGTLAVAGVVKDKIVNIDKPIDYRLTASVMAEFDDSITSYYKDGGNLVITQKGYGFLNLTGNASSTYDGNGYIVKAHFDLALTDDEDSSKQVLTVTLERTYSWVDA